MISFRLLPLCFFIVLAGCTPQSNFEKISWRHGDDVDPLKSLNTLSQDVTQNLTIQNEQQEVSVQTHYGFPVDQTFIKKIATTEGQWVSVAGHIRPSLPTVDPKVIQKFRNPNAAKAKILDLHRQHISDFTTFKALWNENSLLVWEGLYFDQRGYPHKIQFDENLKLVSVQTVRLHSFDRTATLYPKGPKLSHLEEVPIRNLNIKSDLSNDLVRITSKLPLEFDSSQQELNFNPQDHHFDSLQVFYYVDQVRRWCEGALQFGLKIPLDIQLQTGYPEKTNAAFYYAGNIRLGTGDGETYSNIPQDVSIVSHEVFHSLIDTLAGLPHEGEGGSLNEAFADFFTSQLIERPHLAESAFMPAPYKRTLKDPKLWSQKVGALYGDSLIISSLLWEMSEKISKEKMRLIAIKVLSRLNPTSLFVDFNIELQNVLKSELNYEEMETAKKILMERQFPDVTN